MDPQTARAAIEQRRAEAIARLADLRASHADVVAAAEMSNGDDEHDVEGTTVAATRSQIAALISAAAEQLAQLDGALARVEAGTYGTCRECAGPIGEARLEARPSAQTCITCAARKG